MTELAGILQIYLFISNAFLLFLCFFSISITLKSFTTFPLLLLCSKCTLYVCTMLFCIIILYNVQLVHFLLIIDLLCFFLGNSPFDPRYMASQLQWIWYTYTPLLSRTFGGSLLLTESACKFLLLAETRIIPYFFLNLLVILSMTLGI